MKTKIGRVSDELWKEMRRIAKQNEMSLVDASKEVAKELRKKRNKKVIREIQF